MEDFGLQTGHTVELGADGSEKNNDRVVARLGHNVFKGARVEVDDALVGRRLGAQTSHLFGKEGLARGLGRCQSR